MAMISLDDFENRKEDYLSTESVIGQLFGIASQMPEANMIFFTPPSIPGFGASSGFDLKLLDRSGGDLNEFSEVTQGFIGELMKRPEIQYARDRKSTRLNSSHVAISYAVYCLKKK